MPVETRPFGPDATPVSPPGIGCGVVGGMMVRGAAADQERAVAMAGDCGSAWKIGSSANLMVGSHWQMRVRT